MSESENTIRLYLQAEIPRDRLDEVKRFMAEIAVGETSKVNTKKVILPKAEEHKPTVEVPIQFAGRLSPMDYDVFSNILDEEGLSGQNKTRLWNTLKNWGFINNPEGEEFPRDKQLSNSSARNLKARISEEKRIYSLNHDKPYVNNYITADDIRSLGLVINVNNIAVLIESGKLDELEANPENRLGPKTRAALIHLVSNQIELLRSEEVSPSN